MVLKGKEFHLAGSGFAEADGYMKATVVGVDTNGNIIFDDSKGNEHKISFESFMTMEGEGLVMTDEQWQNVPQELKDSLASLNQHAKGKQNPTDLSKELQNRVFQLAAEEVGATQ